MFSHASTRISNPRVVSRFPLLLTAGLSLMFSPSPGETWQANPELVERLSERHPNVNYREAHVTDYDLPDPLLTTDGERIRTREEWEFHRPQLLEAFREQMYGRRPGRPEDLSFHVVERVEGALDGKADFERIIVRCHQEGREFEFELGLFIPVARTGPVPASLLIDFRGRERDPADPDDLGYRPPHLVIARGFAAAIFRNHQLAPDNAERFTQGVIALFEGETESRPPNSWMAIAAWGWGASRAMDYFEQDERIDSTRVAVVGASRNGKAALWTAAEDERFDIAISHLSGCGGAALSRRRYGETLEIINRQFPHWFTENFKQFSNQEDQLPFDQHQLIALIAPRAVYVASADEDLWADPRGEYLSLAHGSKVYALWEYEPLDPDTMPALNKPLFADPLGYHIREGGHTFTAYDWEHFLDFAQKRWE